MLLNKLNGSFVTLSGVICFMSLCFVSLFLSSCTPQDPVKLDLKSPCAYVKHNGDVSGVNPCEKHVPKLNSLYIT